MQDTPPLIVTIMLDDASHTYFTSLRNQYFPKHCNYLEAHLTLFHNLPSHILQIDEVMEQLSNRAQLNMQVTSVKNIGNGNVFSIACKELQVLHKTMQHSFAKYLIRQDRQKLSPHITVQNKVTAFKAAATNSILTKDFKPFAVQGVGFASWQYLKGPWKPEKEYLFAEKK